MRTQSSWSWAIDLRTNSWGSCAQAAATVMSTNTVCRSGPISDDSVAGMTSRRGRALTSEYLRFQGLSGQGHDGEWVAFDRMCPYETPPNIDGTASFDGRDCAGGRYDGHVGRIVQIQRTGRADQGVAEGRFGDHGHRRGTARRNRADQGRQTPDRKSVV